MGPAVMQQPKKKPRAQPASKLCWHTPPRGMPLASSQDGSRTYGWTGGMASFPSQPPTLTVPPYTELEFPLYLKPTSEAFQDVVVAVVRSLRQPSTPLNTAFFSRQNVDAVQAAIQAKIAETMGLSIDRQSDWELLLIMRRVYLETANNWPEDLDAEVERLDALVLQISADAVSRNITRYMVYRSRLPMPVPMNNPADMLTAQPYETGTPVPLSDLNAEYEMSRGA